MDQKFLIVLLVAIFCNGVIYASPVNENHSEVTLSEEKPPTNSAVTIDHKKVEQTLVSTLENTASVTQKSAAPLDHTDESVSVHTDANKLSTSEAPHISYSKNKTSDLISKTPTSVIENKNSSLVPSMKNISQPIDNKSFIPTEGFENVSIPVVVPSVTDSTVSPFAHSPQSVSTPSAVSSTSSATTTLKLNNSVKADVTTVAPNPTSLDKIVVHNVPSPDQEKHFDGPSFIGGIVLTIGLTAIAFIAFKYFKSGKIDINYRTL